MAKQVTPLQLLIAGIIFLGVGLAEYGKVEYDFIIILLGLLFLVVGIIAYLHK